MSQSDENEHLPGFDALAADERRHEDYVRLSSEHLDALIEGAKALGVKVDEDNSLSFSTAASRLATLELDASPERPAQLKRHVMEMMATQVSPLIIEAFVRHSGAKRLTDEDIPKLDKVIAEVQERDAVFSGIFAEIASTVQSMGMVSSSASLFRINTFLNDLADAVYRLRYSTPADDLERSRADTIDRFRTYAEHLGLEPVFGVLAVNLFSK